MFRVIKIPKPFSYETLKVITDLEKIEPTKIEYDTYYVFTESNSEVLPPKDFEILIPFFGGPMKVKFKCPKCGKEFTTMANKSEDKTFIECEIQFCHHCGQEFDWRL